ncbi:hypothetical protein ACET3Z_025598 [Daucus carota]
MTAEAKTFVYIDCTGLFNMVEFYPQKCLIFFELLLCFKDLTFGIQVSCFLFITFLNNQSKAADRKIYCGCLRNSPLGSKL